ncbi:hypothetical protein GUITHDRAFT_151581 [Guillardia theta CCMP2712]|uniref:Uncharacterized protein n=3 Tax=Guillardia theta TaxID=55529 RepID=L1JLH2_GUITC|nr:hypothetical protein GUITHDRAFT_151581 [Guillardia theta CCMP2712]EKX49009.1 hypothetical protein GUITHDRAFT_151581 [Guillardia theta CCMP2712]|eukprot:XP_005835989.1 hypothetical protein GUITHDRAFT_151581 [Guillardia theta CCMP2712]
MGHARRVARACGGYSMLWRSIRQILIFVRPRDIMKAWHFLRVVGIIKALALSPVIFRSIFGSFTILRVMISWLNKGWGGAFNFILRRKAPLRDREVKVDAVRSLRKQAKLKL